MNRSRVRAPTSAVKNSLAGAAILPRPAARVFRRGQERRFCMIRGESHSDQKMAGEADLDTVELLCGSEPPAEYQRILDSIFFPAAAAR